MNHVFEALQVSTIGDFCIHHLGELNASSLVLMLGRSNVSRRSASIDALLGELHTLGLTVCWFERIGVRNARCREAVLAAMRSAWLDTFSSRHPLAGMVATKLLRLALKIRYPKRRYGLFAKWPTDTDAKEDLRHFLHTLPAKQVHIVSHSAGGLEASQAESAPAIRKVICFGYPFKHPALPDEAFRTAHLAGIRKPFLIIQGDRDEYGDVHMARRHALSPQIVLASIDADHDYDLLGRPAFDQARQLVLRFLQPALTEPTREDDRNVAARLRDIT